MTRDEIIAAVADELGKIAPEIDLDLIDGTADLREEFDIDSMDFLTFVTALHERMGIDIPEADYTKLETLDATVAYLETKLDV
jgi:acyl carrier protein